MKDYENNLVFWRTLSDLWKEEHDAVCRKMKSIVRRIKKDVKDYGKIQDETIKKLEELAR